MVRTAVPVTSGVAVAVSDTEAEGDSVPVRQAEADTEAHADSEGEAEAEPDSEGEPLRVPLTLPVVQQEPEGVPVWVSDASRVEEMVTLGEPDTEAQVVTEGLPAPVPVGAGPLALTLALTL